MLLSNLAFRRSLFFQKRISDFDEKAEDQQHDITSALAFVSAIDVGDDPEQIEVRNSIMNGARFRILRVQTMRYLLCP